MPRAHGCARAANHLGQRISKTVAGVKTYFVYSDIDGQMLGEYTATGTPIREYIYLEGERVAMYDYTGVEPKDSTNNKAIVYLHNDHIGQAHIGMNSDGQFIYERVQTPFGETMSEMNVYNVQVPVRFPGQYYDSESGFSQNWHRDYDSSIGRYVQSDPIGLRGGINTFGYVGGNPVMWVDIAGLLSAEAESYADKDIASSGDIYGAWEKSRQRRKAEGWEDGTPAHEEENYLYGQLLIIVDGYPSAVAHGGAVLHAGKTVIKGRYSWPAHKAGHEGAQDGGQDPDGGDASYYDDGYSCRKSMPPANYGSPPRAPCYWVRGHVVCSSGYGGWRDTR